MKKIIYTMVLALVCFSHANSQGITNSGNYIKVSHGAFIKVSGIKGNFTINQSGSLYGKIQNNGEIYLQGNWINNSSVGNVFINPTGTTGEVEFNGTAPQTIGGTQSTYFDNLTVNNDSGVAIKLDEKINNKLNLINGIVSTGSNKIIIADSGINAITYQSVNSYINGNIRKYIQSGKQYNLPVGTSDFYEPATVTITSLGQLNYMDVYFIHASAGSVPDSLFLNGFPVSEFLDYGYWRIIADNDSNTTYNISVTSRGQSNGAAIASDQALFYRSNGGVWQNFGVNNDTTQSGTGTDPVTAKRTNCQHFYEYAIGKIADGTTLPVDLINYQAICSNNHTVTINWSTAAETNNNFFTVLKSTDAENWTVLGTVPGAGNSNELRTYGLTDDNYYSNIAYYRLKQTDFNGNSKSFNILSAECNSDGILSLSLYPNPVNGILNIKTNMEADNYNLKIMNQEGQLCYTYNFTGNASLDVSTLKPALYYVIITDQSSGEQNKQKIVVL
jgi:hypothetical protein